MLARELLSSRGRRFVPALLVSTFISTASGGSAMAQDSATPADPAIVAAQRSKAVSEAQKAASDAQTAAIGAQSASLKGAVDALPSSTTTGKVDVKADGGKAEATLLSAKATIDAAARIVTAVQSHLDGVKTLSIYAGAERPSLDHWAAFNLRLQLLQTAVAPKAQHLDNDAVTALAKVKLTAAPPHATAEIAPVMIALGLSALTKVAALFQTDYEAGGITLQPDDAMLATAVGGGLKAAQGDKLKVILTSRTTALGADDSLLALLKPVAENGAQAQARIAFFQERAKALRADASAKDPAFADAAGACDQAAAAWLVVSNGYDALLTSATLPDSTGALPLVKIAVEKQLSEALKANQAVLIVQMNANVGSYYTKKNIFTTFGAEPFYVAAGVVVTYTMVAGADGTILTAGVIPLHGGYGLVRDVPSKIN